MPGEFVAKNSHPVYRTARLKVSLNFLGRSAIVDLDYASKLAYDKEKKNADISNIDTS